jgi:hypothetical protein
MQPGKRYGRVAAIQQVLDRAFAGGNTRYAYGAMAT